MHVSSKEVDKGGTHIITDILEADGAVELASPDAKFVVKVLSVQRTDSGGVKLQVALNIQEPAPKEPPKPEDAALSFLKEKGHSDKKAKEMLEKFGHDRIRARMAKAAAEKEAALDDELDKNLG